MKLTTTSSPTIPGSLWFDTALCQVQFTWCGGSWSTGGALITARISLAGAGTQNAGLAFGGSPGRSCTEEYDGSSWSTGGALSAARYALAGAGTQTAGLAFGGIVPSVLLSCTEEYSEKINVSYLSGNKGF